MGSKDRIKKSQRCYPVVRPSVLMLAERFKD